MGRPPKRSPQQQLGQLGEQAFAKFVAAEGDLWHPTALGSDFGLDGRVELVDGDEPTGVEFGVQVKAAEQLLSSRRGLVAAGEARSGTVLYWLSRLSPTLLVAYSRVGDHLYGGWAHRTTAATKLRSATRAPARLTLRIPGEELSAARWQELRAEAKAMQGVVVSAFNDDAVRQMFGLIHHELTTIADVLVEWAYSLAYQGETKIALPSGAVMSVPRLNPPRLGREEGGGHMFVVWLAQAATVMAEAFSKSLRSELEEGHPLVKLVSDLAVSLRRHYDEMYVDAQPPPSTGKLTWARLDVTATITNLGVIPLLIRDFNREIRPFLFPMAAALRPLAAPGDAQDRKIITSLSDLLFTPTSEWLEGFDLAEARQAAQAEIKQGDGA